MQAHGIVTAAIALFVAGPGHATDKLEPGESVPTIRLEGSPPAAWSPATAWLTLPHSSFVGKGAVYGVLPLGAGSGLMAAVCTETSGSLRATVLLPQGAAISGVKCLVKGFMSGGLDQQVVSRIEYPMSFIAKTAPNEFQYAYTRPAEPVTIDDQTSYWINVQAGTGTIACVSWCSIAYNPPAW